MSLLVPVLLVVLVLDLYGGLHAEKQTHSLLDALNRGLKQVSCRLER